MKQEKDQDFTFFKIFTFFFKFYLFILRERKNMQEQGEGRQRGKERIPSRLCAISTEPDEGLNPKNYEIMT